MKLFLSIAAVLVVLLGAGWLLSPGTMLARWGVQTDPVGVFVARRYGGMLIGYATVLWLGRAAGPSSARQAILGGGAVVTTLVTCLSLGGVLTGTIGPGGWVTVVIEGVLAAGFLYYFLTGRSRQPGTTTA